MAMGGCEGVVMGRGGFEGVVMVRGGVMIRFEGLN